MEPGRVRPARSSGSWRSAAATSTCGRERSAPSSACRSRSTRRPRRSPAARRLGRRSPRSCSPASTCSCSTSRRTTSTSTGSTGWSASSTAFAGGLAVVSHDRAFLDRTVDRIAEIDPWTGSVREYAGGWSDYAAARERARAKQYAAFEAAQERTGEVEALLQARRNQARAGGGFLAHATGGSDRRGTKALSGKVRRHERSLERIEQVEKPYEPWRAAPLAGSGAAARRSGRFARRRGRSNAEASGSAPSISTSHRASASRSRAEREREDDVAGAAARRAPAGSREPPDRALDA